MDRITNIETTGNTTKFIFNTQDVTEVNILKRAILSEIETYAIDLVIFQINTSPRQDEVIALRLGQVVIDHSRFVPPQEGNFRTTINYQGPGEFTTDHIVGLPFKYVTPIAQLRANERILCDVIVKRGTAKQHVKWRPISTFTFVELNNGYEITIKDIGMLPPVEIIEKGLAKMVDAARRPATTLFSRPLVPHNI